MVHTYAGACMPSANVSIWSIYFSSFVINTGSNTRKYCAMLCGLKVRLDMVEKKVVVC